MNGRLKNSKTAPFLIDATKKVYSEDIEKAELFNDHFISVFTEDNQNANAFLKLNQVKMTKLSFNEDMVCVDLRKMKASLSIDPDGLCAFFLKKISFSVCRPLSHIFNICYETGILLDAWKKAVVVALHKKGDMSKACNYRPISLCSVVCKLMESIINSHLLLHLESNNLLSANQFGFRKNKSCPLQLKKLHQGSNFRLKLENCNLQSGHCGKIKI